MEYGSAQGDHVKYLLSLNLLPESFPSSSLRRCGRSQGISRGLRIAYRSTRIDGDTAYNMAVQQSSGLSYPSYVKVMPRLALLVLHIDGSIPLR